MCGSPVGPCTEIHLVAEPAYPGLRQLTELGLIDEYQLMVVPIVLGTGKNFLAKVRQMDLELIEGKVFKNGIVQLRYRPA